MIKKVFTATSFIDKEVYFIARSAIEALHGFVGFYTTSLESWASGSVIPPKICETIRLLNADGDVCSENQSKCIHGPLSINYKEEEDVVVVSDSRLDKWYYTIVESEEQDFKETYKDIVSIKENIGLQINTIFDGYIPTNGHFVKAHVGFNISTNTMWLNNLILNDPTVVDPSKSVKLVLFGYVEQE